MKIIACAALAAAILAFLAGMGTPARADGPDARNAGNAPAEIMVGDLSAIPDGYDAALAPMAYTIAIHES